MKLVRIRLMSKAGRLASCSSCLRGTVYGLRAPAQQFEEGRGGVREGRAAQVGGPEDALVGEAADGDGGERAALDLFGDAHARHDGEADLPLDEALDGLDGGEFEDDVERRVVLGERLDDALARRRADVVREERLLAQLFQAHRLARGQAVARTHDEHQLVFEDGEGLKLAVPRLEGHQREVQCAVNHPARELLRGVAEQFDQNVRVALAELEDEVGQEVERRALVRADAHAPALERAHLGHGLARLVAQGDDAARVVVDDAAHVGERGRLLRAVEQRRADLLFEAAYRQAHGGLRAVDALRRLREAALLDDLQEEFQLRYLHLNPWERGHLGPPKLAEQASILPLQ